MTRHASEDSESGLCLCIYPWKNMMSLLIHAEVSKLVIKDAEEVVKGHLYGVKVWFLPIKSLHIMGGIFFNHI